VNGFRRSLIAGSDKNPAKLSKKFLKEPPRFLRAIDGRKTTLAGMKLKIATNKS